MVTTSLRFAWFNELARRIAAEGNIVLNIDGESPIDDERILEYVPDFRLDAVTTDLWGEIGCGVMNSRSLKTDRKIIAIEYGDFAQAIAGEHQVEVDAAQGTRSVAVSYGILESGEIGRIVTLDEMLVEQVDDYQSEINDSLGI